jgi:hypothetical protein
MSFYIFFIFLQSLKATDDGEIIIAHELKGIHERKMIIQQKLEQFHHRNSTLFAQNG